MAEAFETASADSSLVLVQQSQGRGRLTRAQRLDRAQALRAEMPRSTRSVLDVALGALDTALERLVRQIGGGSAMTDALRMAVETARVDERRAGHARAGPVVHTTATVAAAPRATAPSAVTYETGRW